MADNSGFRVDRLGSVDVRTGGKADRIFTILDYPWIAIWMSPRETIKKIVNRDPTHQVIMLGALAGGLSMLNFFLAAALNFTPTPLPARLVPYLPILTLASPFLGAAFGLLGLYIGAFLMDWAAVRWAARVTRSRCGRRWPGPRCRRSASPPRCC